MVDVSAAINVYKNLKCSPDINSYLSTKKILENWVWCKVPFEASVARQKITGSSYICRALPEWNWGQLQSQSDKRGAEIVADNNHQYFINGDDRNWGSKCADPPKKGKMKKVFWASFDKRGSYLIVCYQVASTSRKKINEGLQIRHPYNGQRFNLAMTQSRWWNTGCGVFENE